MMGLGNKQDAIDKLLRASSARPGGPPQACREFDADLANAYVERHLTTSEIARYEQHLSACAPCRKSVVALARMAAADPATSLADAKSVTPGKPQTGWLASLGGRFGALLTPRWAMAAVAAIVLVISLPFLLARKDSRMADQVAQTDSATARSTGQPSTAGKPEADATGQNEALAVNATPQPNQPPAASIARPRAESEQARSNGPETAPAQVPTAEAPAPDATALAKAEPASQPDATKSANETAGKVAEHAPSGVAGGVAATKQNNEALPKIDETQAKSLPTDKDKAEVTTLRPGRADGEDREKKEATIRPDDNIAPPPAAKAAAPPEAHGRRMAKATGSALRDSREEAARAKARLPGKKVAKKQFWLRDDVWTDEDYNPDKEMPVVTLIRDSDVYKEVLTKRAGMKSYLTGFSENERVIFVYKGTVYKLVPQEGNK